MHWYAIVTLKYVLSTINFGKIVLPSARFMRGILAWPIQFYHHINALTIRTIFLKWSTCGIHREGVSIKSLLRPSPFTLEKIILEIQLTWTMVVHDGTSDIGSVRASSKPPIPCSNSLTVRFLWGLDDGRIIEKWS